METTKELKNEVSNGARQATRQASKQASQLKDSAMDTIEGWREDVEARYHDVEKRAREIASASYDVVKTYPIYSVLGAAAIGFLAGSIMSRRN